MIESILASNVLDVLIVLFQHREEPVYQSKIVALSGLKKMQVQRALARLQKAELIIVSKEGNMNYYQLNTNHPILIDLKNILYKTVLVADPFKEVLNDIKDIDLAFIYGSFASGTESSESDIDLFVVGAVGLRKLSKLLAPIAKQLQREINPVVYPKEEFVNKITSKDHFIKSVMSTKKMWLVGDENEFKEMVK